MRQSLQAHLSTRRRYDIIDLGAAVSRGQTLTHRDLVEPYLGRYTGVDIVASPNVDVVMTRPYTIPLPSRSADVVISGQAFEHIPFPWATALEIRRVLRPGGLAIVTAPSRGHVHDVHDCWRYYPDGMRALAHWTGMEIVEARTDFPPALAGSRRHDYAAIDANRYWGDTVGVFRRPAGLPSPPHFVVSRVIRWWANRQPNLWNS